MKRRLRRTLALTGGIVVLAGTLGACTPDEKEVATTDVDDKANLETALPAPEDVDWLVLEEDAVVPVLDELAESLQAAHLALDRKDPTAAAAEIRRGAAFLGSEVEGATQEQRARLEAATADLEALAEEIAGGLGADANRLTRTFQEAYAADTQERWALLEEEILLPHADAPENHFLKAEQALAEEDTKTAALELRKGVAFMRLEMSWSDENEVPQLVEAEAGLTDLAAEVESGNLEEDLAFERGVAHASLALAQAHLARARVASEVEDVEVTAASLRNAGSYLERGAVWAQAELSAATSSAIADARSLSKTMPDEGDWSNKDVEKVLKQLDQGCKQLQLVLGPTGLHHNEADQPS